MKENQKSKIGVYLEVVRITQGYWQNHCLLEHIGVPMHLSLKLGVYLVLFASDSQFFLPHVNVVNMTPTLGVDPIGISSRCLSSD